MESTLFLLKTGVLKKQIVFQRIDGPSLSQLSKLSQPSNIFTRFEDAFKETFIVRKDEESLMRCLYLAVLTLCCDQHYERAEELSSRFKERAYSQKYTGTALRHVSDRATQLMFSNDWVVKKIAYQFFVEVMYKKKQQVWAIVNRIPCLDYLMTNIIKKVLNIHEHSSFDNIRESMATRLNIVMKRTSFSSFTIGDKIVVREDEGWVLEITTRSHGMDYRVDLPLNKLSTFLGPRVAISQESNSIRSQHELSDIIERVGPECSSEEKSASRHEAEVQQFTLKPEQTSFLRDRKEPFSIFDGMSSDAIVSLLSPRHIRNMNQRKKQSIMTVMGSSKTMARLKPDRDTQSQNGDTQSSKPSSSQRNSRMKVLESSYHKVINTPYAIKHPSVKTTPKPQVITFSYSNTKHKEPRLVGAVSRLDIKPTGVLNFQPRKPTSHRVSRIKSPVFI